MDKSAKTIVVPWGLTMMSEVAFEHAVNIAKVSDVDITIVKVVKNENNVKHAKKDLEEVCEDLNKKYSFKPSFIVSHGSIYKRFTEIAEEIGSNIIIKHTSGISGIDKILGGKTIKIVGGSKIPYIVVQDKPIRGKIEKVLLPIDYTKESKEKINWLSYLSRFFKPTVYLVTPPTSDDRKLRLIKNNLQFAKQILDDKEIYFEHHVCQGNKDFADAFLDEAKKFDVDMLMIMLPKDFGLTDVLFGSKEQEVIANKYKIPVMCINPRDDLRLTGWK